MASTWEDCHRPLPNVEAFLSLFPSPPCFLERRFGHFHLGSWEASCYIKTFLLVHPRVIEITPLMHCICSFMFDKTFFSKVTFTACLQLLNMVFISFLTSLWIGRNLVDVPQLPGGDGGYRLGDSVSRTHGCSTTPEGPESWASQTTWRSRNIWGSSLYLPPCYLLRKIPF